jgi:hypothetical protein
MFSLLLGDKRHTRRFHQSVNTSLHPGFGYDEIPEPMLGVGWT